MEGETLDGCVVLMLQQTMLVLLECLAQPNELIARLGCACMR